MFVTKRWPIFNLTLIPQGAFYYYIIENCEKVEIYPSRALISDLRRIKI